MIPHINIGVIGHLSILNRPLLSELISAAVKEQLPHTDVKIHWIESDHEELLGGIFQQSKVDDYEILRRFDTIMDTIPITIKDQPVRSDFDFQRRSNKNRFFQDKKSQKIKTKHRRA
jgi:hypothetical protein